MRRAVISAAGLTSTSFAGPVRFARKASCAAPDPAHCARRGRPIGRQTQKFCEPITESRALTLEYIRDRGRRLQVQWLGTEKSLQFSVVRRLAYAIGYGATDLEPELKRMLEIAPDAATLQEIVHELREIGAAGTSGGTTTDVLCEGGASVRLRAQGVHGADATHCGPFAIRLADARGLLTGSCAGGEVASGVVGATERSATVWAGGHDTGVSGTFDRTIARP